MMVIELYIERVVCVLDGVWLLVGKGWRNGVIYFGLREDGMVVLVVDDGIV